MSEYLIETKNIKVHFPVYGGILRRKTGKVYAVDGVSIKVKKGETIGLVGESGCGKTTTGRAIIRLYNLTKGDIFFEGENISRLSDREMRPHRRNMQMIFQDPFESLDARQTIGDILEEPLLVHKLGSSQTRLEEVLNLLSRVGIPQNAVNRFPHEFSGGQRQRIGIARSIALKPKLIVCDEPVSALDVSIQSQILNLLIDLQSEMNLTYIFIAHDLSVVKHISDNIAVMYLGKIVEYTDADSIYENPLHPYTKALISAIPVPDPSIKNKKIVLYGDVPSPLNPPSGCRFHTRCPVAFDRCSIDEPELQPVPEAHGLGHLAACHLING
ncbi:MAG: ATP-binding cassette domain-containing protein [Proteobacteria bacterium]|nr:ATP-binding cassette domain-containing protein [Pseudomonadota bacterium]